DPAPWPRNDQPRRAGVSSFGISGTNAHIILQEPPPQHTNTTDQAPTAPPLPSIPLLISAKTEAALLAQADQLRDHLLSPARPKLLDVAFSLATTRQPLEHRAAVLGVDRDAVLTGLSSLSRDAAAAGVTKNRARTGGVAFLFSGQGSQRPGMGAGLYRDFPVFTQAFDEVCDQFTPLLGFELKEIVFSQPDSSQARLLDVTEFTQPALFALELALCRLVESFAIKPDYLIGHSVGELAAAHVAGVFSLADACALVAARGRLMAELPTGGAMLAVQAPEADVAAELASYAERVAIAAVNGPDAVVLSGDRDAIERLRATWRQRGCKVTLLNVSHAFHSPRIDPMLERYREVAETVTFNAPEIPLVCNVTGDQRDADPCSPDYWVAQARETVRFAAGIATLERSGVGRFLELGPDGVLSAMVRQCVSADIEAGALIIPAMRARGGDGEALIAMLAAAHTHGVHVDWAALFRGRGAERTDLPSYPFQRQRFWLQPRASGGDLRAAGLGSADHPLLAAALAIAGRDEWLFSACLSLATHPWLGDHAVLGAVILPATAFLDMALAAGTYAGLETVEELTLRAPLIVPPEQAVTLQISLGAPDGAGRRAIAIHARVQRDNDDGIEQAWTCHASGLLSAAAGAAIEPLAAAQWPPSGSKPLHNDALYTRLAELGFEYGPAFQGFLRGWRRGEEVFAEVALAPAQSDEAARFALHPALLDAAGHAALDRLCERQPDSPALPFCWRGVRIHQRGLATLRARVTPARDGAIRIDTFDERGRPVLSAESLALRPIPPGHLSGARTDPAGALFALHWAELELALNGRVNRCAVIGELDVGDQKIERHRDLATLTAAVTDTGQPPDVALVCAPGGNCSASLASAVHDGVQATLALVQEWLDAEELRASQLAIVTREAVAVSDGDSPDPVGAAVWGLIGAAQAEHPGRILLLDIDDAEIPWRVLLAAGEEQLAIRDGTAYQPRLQPAAASALLPPPGEREWHLVSGANGTLDTLTLQTNSRPQPSLGASEVRVAVRAAGLNFRDVLIALGQYPVAAPLGGEAAGVVLEVGADVTDLTPGQRVMGLIDHAFGPVAVTDRNRLVTLPHRWSFVQAAALPVASLTAYHALVDLAELSPRETVLIHCGAGGVGMAAVQIARRCGAEVFATASPAKWGTLQGLGLDDDHIASSRDLAFYEQFLAATGGRGVDVVLNALTGDFVDASLQLLAHSGRFIEIGKADIRDHQTIAADHPSISYQAFDLAQLPPPRLQELLRNIVELFEQGSLHDPPIRTWDVRHSVEAFRHLRQGDNVGKVVLTVPQQPDPAGTVLITGGTGGLGALVARDITRQHSIRHLLLVSRRGMKAAGASQLVSDLASEGIEVKVIACDVADRGALADALATVNPEHPLTAVVHAAGVIDDALIEALTPEQVTNVLRPKVEGALHLHELTEGIDLAEFVLFSSAGAVIGAPGQANYAAANAFLGALACQRRARGLVGQALAWGLWAESGMTAGMDECDRARLARRGLAPITDAQGVALFTAARSTDEALVLPMRLRGTDREALPALLRGVVRVPPRRSVNAPRLVDRLRTGPDAERAVVIEELVRSHVAAVLDYSSVETVDVQRALKELGVDSLAGLELRNRLNHATGLTLPVTLVFEHPNVSAIAEHLCAQLQGETASDSDETTIRRAISSISLARLQDSGLLRPLLDLAQLPDAGAAPHEDGEADTDAIATMTVGELVREALTASEQVA
ncbi:MAG: type I polyketide synthase, partial [Solirubrobacteraceae bacterium]